MFVVAEPGEHADKFLQSVKLSLLSVMRSNRRKAASVLATISTIADLVRCRPYFQVGNVVHRYIGRQTQVCILYIFILSDYYLCHLSEVITNNYVVMFGKIMEDDQEIAAYMFRRTVPSMHLTSDDVRWMVCIFSEILLSLLMFIEL